MGCTASAPSDVPAKVDLKPKPVENSVKNDSQTLEGDVKTLFQGEKEPIDPIRIINANLPEDPLLLTPFGEIRMTYADYTASGRALKCVEDYLHQVVAPNFANTHTESSASGLQTTHFREEARNIILSSVHASPKRYDLIFHGTGSTGAINKLIQLLGIHAHPYLQKYLKDIPVEDRPLILISEQEHHSNELMWRESVADVITIGTTKKGTLDLVELEKVLKENRSTRSLIIGSFSAGSNVTGLTNETGPIARLMHSYDAFCCFDFAAAAPYVDIHVEPQEMPSWFTGTQEDWELSYIDAIYISPHKFVGGPGTPGLLVVRKTLASRLRDPAKDAPSIPAGGTVRIVSCVQADYDPVITHREEGGTPGIMEAIRCGLVFWLRNQVGPARIMELEGDYAQRAVERLQAKGVKIIGEEFTNIRSAHRLSITSFEIPAKPNGTQLTNPVTGQDLCLHPNFVAALLNDLYGIQARSGCSCAGPLGMRLFGLSEEKQMELHEATAKDSQPTRPSWCRVNFNYFIPESEFDFICSAIEQVMEHGWKLLPLYAQCLITGQYWYNGDFDRFSAVHTIDEVKFEPSGKVSFEAVRTTDTPRETYLKNATEIYEKAPQLVRKMLHRFRDLRRKTIRVSDYVQTHRWHCWGSEILPLLGIAEQDIEKAANSPLAKSETSNPTIVGRITRDGSKNPMWTMRPPVG